MRGLTQPPSEFSAIPDLVRKTPAPWKANLALSVEIFWLGDLDSNQGFPSQSRKFYR